MSNWKNDSWNNQSTGFNGAQQGFGAPAQSASGSVWDNFETVDTSPQRNGFVPPNLDAHVTIVELKTIQSVKNNNRPIFVATIETEGGARYDWVAKADERPYLQNIKALVVALNPEGDPRSFGRALMEALTGPEQPAAGKRVHVRSETILTRNGNEFTKCHWSAPRH